MPWTSHYEHGGIGSGIAVLLAMGGAPLLMIYAYEVSKSAAAEFKKTMRNNY